jgi:hypothetical protein
MSDRVRLRRALAVFLVAIGLASTPAVEPSSELATEEKLLREAGVATDGPGLVAFFHSRVLAAGDQVRLTAAVQRLGDNDFATREKASQELLAAGRLALPYLRPVLRDSDREVARRARRCVAEIEQTPYTTLMSAAAHLAAARQPPGLSEALLACLPWVDDEVVEEAVFNALLQVGLKDGVADRTITAAAKDREPARRAAVAFVLAQAHPEQRRQAARLLGDADPRVRFHAASGLVRSGERAAVPVLLALLTEAPLALTWQVEDLLGRLAGDQAPALSLGAGPNPIDRQRCRSAWEAWWKENGGKVDLTQVNQEESVQGLNVVSELDGAPGGNGRIWECGRDGKIRWQITNVQRPIDARVLAGGRVLVAEHGPARVTERDRDGKVLWEQPAANQPVCCQRLANGNTVIATYGELFEVTRDHKIVFSHKPSAMLYFAQKLRNGHYVCVQSNNQVVEIDAQGREVVTISIGVTGGWASVERLSNGHFLVALYSGRKVVEYDSMGNGIWECRVDSPGHATRLRNGHTLVASIEGRQVIEFDRLGNEVWRQATQGRPFHVYRR